MSATGGPDIVEDGLVLALDAANVKSFRGEPTTNLSNGTLSGTIGLTLSTQEVLGPDGNIIVANKANVNSSSGTIRFLMQDSINPPTQGQSYTISVWIKRVGSVEATGGWEPELDNDPIYGYRRPSSESGFFGNYQSNPNIQTIPTDWDRVTYTFSYNIQSTVANRSFFYLSGNGSEVLFYQFQIEAKSYATPFVNGTRGATVATGGGWGDRSGNSNHGELVNGPTYNSSNLGSLVFDGVDDVVNVANSPSLQITGNISIMCWIYVTAQVGGQGIITKGPETSDYDYMVYLTSNSTSLSFYKKNVGLVGESAATFTGTFIDRWTHVAFSLNGRVVNGYQNGIFKATTTFNNSGIRSTTNDLRIGRGWSTYFPGRISNIQIYNQALTAAEVLQNYNATKGRFGL